MPVRVELYGAAGVAIGVVTRSGRLREILESGIDLLVEEGVWHPLDGSPAQPSGALSVAGDDIFLAVAEELEDGPVHAQWHDIPLDVGAYRVTGQMPTMPGFDAGRALARPTGEFVLLRDVRIALLEDIEGPSVERPAAFVNRYVVDRVSADMMLGFFVPGAEMVVIDGHERVASPPITAGPPIAADAPIAADSSAISAAPTVQEPAAPLL
jgi:hypothetical protein